MGVYSDMDIEATELTKHPAFRNAVIAIVGEILEPVLENVTDKYAKAFVFRSELASEALKND